MYKYFIIFFVLLVFNSCDYTSETKLGGDFTIWEHDVSQTRNLYYRSQGIGPSPICNVGYDDKYIWVRLCKEKDGITNYLVNRKSYAKNPNQRESDGYWEFYSGADFVNKMSEFGITFKEVGWKKNYDNPYIKSK